MSEMVRESVPATSTEGVHAFLIADLRGYTSFSFERGDEAAGKLAARFARISEEAVSRHEGRVIELRGDESLAVFRSPRDALRAALHLHERLAQESTVDLPLEAGIGLDVGEAVGLREGYRGRALNLAARLCSLAGSGETLASESLVHIAGPVDGLEARDRGAVRLKGIRVSVRVLQLAPTGTLPSNLPLLQAAADAHRTNLPDPPTRLVGRDTEMAVISALLRRPDVRLVTLTGAGGTGKTRLAVETGSALLYDFPDGVFLVQLGSVADSALVLSTIGRTLDVQESGETTLLDVLAAHLHDRRMLLVLDNLEHLLDSVPDVGALLDACRTLKVLATSRSVLRLSREHEVQVEPLPVPVSGHGTPQELLEYDAVRLFVDRVEAVQAGFTLDTRNGPEVAELCTRLDGLPLALELAAARIRLFPLSALRKRLTSRLDLLTGGARDAPSRQQTLRATIDWSYSLLSPREQSLLARLSVFAGGCDLDAASRVCGAEGILDGLERLLEQSLLRQIGDRDSRFSMLETIQEYASERLEASGETESVRHLHAEYFLSLAEKGERELEQGDQALWLERLELEHDNLRAALSWSIEQAMPNSALRLTGALWRFWWIRAYLREGSRWLARALEMPDSGGPENRAKALSGAGNLAWAQGSYEDAERFHREALSLRRKLNDRVGTGRSLNNLGALAETQGRYEEAVSSYEEGLAIAREVDDRRSIALILGNLGGVYVVLGDHAASERACEESLRRFRELGDRVAQTGVLNNMVFLLMSQGLQREAAAFQAQSIELLLETGNTENVAMSLDSAAEILCGLDKTGEAARLWGAGEALRESLGQIVPPNNAEDREKAIVGARRSMGDAAFEQAWREGCEMSPTEAEQYALRLLGDDVGQGTGQR
jgi:non-specific serine/threonine protein kinase